MSKEKQKILTFDTNFIIENQKDFQDLIKNLNEEHIVYVPKFAINERIAQQTREMSEKYETIFNLCKENKIIVKNVTFYKKEDIISAMSKRIEDNYNLEFGDYIIPFNENDVNLYKTALNRAMKKLPPFSKDKNASDRGFKDCLLWLSLINYFKSKSFDNQVVFITKDGGFINNTKLLMEEFKKETGLEISITQSIQNLIENPKQPIIGETIFRPQNIEELRIKLREAISAFCYADITDDYGNYEYSAKSFEINEKINKDQAELFLKRLKSVLDENILSTTLYPSMIFGEAFNINDKHKINIESVENMAKIYDDLNENNQQLLVPLYNEVANQINNNFNKNYISDDDLPF